MPLMALFFTAVTVLAQHTATAPTTGPTTRPYAGLTLRDDPSGKVLVAHIAPGPLEGRGFKSPNLFRGDTILSINNAPMTARQFEELVTNSQVGDEIVLQVKRTGSGTVTAVPEAAVDGKVQEVKFKLADALAWVGPVKYPKLRSLTEAVDAIDHRIAPTAARRPT